MKHTDIWYQNRLNEYFDYHFGQYEDTVEFYTNPAVNEWLFDIPELQLNIKLTCTDDGQIIEIVE